MLCRSRTLRGKSAEVNHVMSTHRGHMSEGAFVRALKIVVPIFFKLNSIMVDRFSDLFDNEAKLLKLTQIDR